jgi:hypothetical protein
VIWLDDGRDVAVTLARDYFSWDGPQGQLDARFANLYEALPWRPGSPPIGATQPAVGSPGHDPPL